MVGFTPTSPPTDHDEAPLLLNVKVVGAGVVVAIELEVVELVKVEVIKVLVELVEEVDDEVNLDDVVNSSLVVVVVGRLVPHAAIRGLFVTSAH